MIIRSFILTFFSLTSLITLASSIYDRAPNEITSACETYIDTFNKNLNNLTSIKSKPNYQTVMQPFDRYLVAFTNQFLHDDLMQNVHPNEAVRKASTECSLKGFAIFNALGMNRPLYNLISQINTNGLSVAQAYTVNYWKKEFETSGIGKDDEARITIKALNDEIDQMNNIFNQNITEDVRSITVKKERLNGLPADYFTNHPADKNNMITITTSYSDISPIYEYAHDRSLREEVSIMSNNRAYPQNKAVLMQILEKRHQLAKMLDHENFAQLNMLGTMVKSPKNVEKFTSTLSAAIKAPVAKEKRRLLTSMQQSNPNSKLVQSWDKSYLSNIIRAEDYQLDAKEVREYFNYDKVRDGIITLAEDLFSLKIKPISRKNWHESVEAYEVFENNKLIGRFFFDSHPREGKFTHAAQFDITLGKKDVEIPEAALLMNFPKGLMEHRQVETFLHEFGHLIHFIFAGQNEIGFSSVQGESDFGEAPSMMLQEWVWDYDTLSKFATNAQGDIIPRKLVEKMNKARYFGQAIGTASQLTYTAMSLELYNRSPEGIELNTFEKNIFQKYSPFQVADNTHIYASFGHLTSYGAKYYTYQWSNAIAEELLTKFKKEGLRNKQTANNYRHKILALTGTAPANELVRDFLGRDFGVNAYAERLNKTE